MPRTRPDSDLRSVGELFEKAKKAGHDSLGIASDCESSMHLAKLARRRFDTTRSLNALRDWEQLLEEIVGMEPDDPNVRTWLRNELIELGFLRDRVRQELDRRLQTEIQEARKVIPSDQRREIERKAHSRWIGDDVTSDLTSEAGAG